MRRLMACLLLTAALALGALACGDDSSSDAAVTPDAHLSDAPSATPDAALPDAP